MLAFTGLPWGCNCPGSPVAQTPGSQCRGLGSIPGQGTRSPVAVIRSLHAIAKERRFCLPQLRRSVAEYMHINTAQEPCSGRAVWAEGWVAGLLPQALKFGDVWGVPVFMGLPPGFPGPHVRDAGFPKRTSNASGSGLPWQNVQSL